MLVLVKELTLEAINSALLRIERSIQTGENNFQQNVARATVSVNNRNVSIGGSSYDDTALRNKITALQDSYDKLSTNVSTNSNKILALEAMLASVDFSYDASTNEITFSLGEYESTFQLKDTTYTFSYDDETGQLTIIDNITGETVFSEVFKDTTYTFSFTNGVLTVHNNWTNTDQTFDFDARYYTEAEIQALVLDKIPPAASSTNQLADKAFVNSSITTATATFRGTVTTTSALSQLTGDLNDYAYLQNIDPATGQTTSYDRYKWVETGGDYGHWKYEYTLNNSSYTADQWAAINSGITCTIVQNLLDGCYSGGSTLTKSAGNEWRSLIATNCDSSSPVLPTTNYYNTNVQVNQCTGQLRASRFYATAPGGYALMAKQQIVASDIGLTAATAYPICCILNQIVECYGGAAGTYAFCYAFAYSPIICETNDYAFNAIIVKYDDYSLIANYCRTRWSVINIDGREWSVHGYRTADTTRYWTVCSCNAGQVISYINRTCINNDDTFYPLFSNGYTTGIINNVCANNKIKYNPSSGTLDVCVLSAGNPVRCTSSQAGSAGNLMGSGWIEMFHDTPYIDFHCNYACTDYSARIINRNSALEFIVNNASGCTASNLSSSFNMYNCGRFDTKYITFQSERKNATALYESILACDIGLTAGCCYSLVTILGCLERRLPINNVPTTYKFMVAYACVPMVCQCLEKGIDLSYAFCYTFQRLTACSVISPSSTYQYQQWLVTCISHVADTSPLQWVVAHNVMCIAGTDTWTISPPSGNDWVLVCTYTVATPSAACCYFITRPFSTGCTQDKNIEFMVVTCVSGCTNQKTIVKGCVLTSGASSQANSDAISIDYTSTFCALYPVQAHITNEAVHNLLIAYAYCPGCTYTNYFYIRRSNISSIDASSVTALVVDSFIPASGSRTSVYVNTSSNCNAGKLVTALSANQVTAYCLATYSKRVLKKDIQPFSHCALCLFRQTDVMSYRYKTEADDALVHVGFIADDTPMLLSGEHKDTMRINDTVGLLIKAVKELDERTMPLTNKIKEILKKWKKRLVK